MRFLREGESNITVVLPRTQKQKPLLTILLMETTKQNRRRPITKRKGRRRKNALLIDRLSGLPDEILSHILSFLPTKTAAATSVLATKWRFLWQFVPNLDFHSDNSDTINRILLLHQRQTINSFRLYLDDDFSGGDFQIETWILAAIARNVQKLHLYCFYDKILPLRLLTCETLVDLALNNCGVIPQFSSVWLPRLKKLHLTSVLYGGDDSLPNLLSGCPVLEDLLIGYILYDDLVCCKISSPTVKYLEVHFEFSELDSYNHDFRVEINTPALEHLCMSDELSEHIECGDLTSLVKASFIPCDEYAKEDDSVYCASVLEFVKKLSNVETLSLNLSSFEGVIDSVFSAWTISFNNLTELELYADCHFLVKFLESAHNLQMLIFWQVSIHWEDWREPQQVPACLVSHLKAIRFLEFGCEENEFEIVRYLLRNARVLEAMEVAFSDELDSDEKNDILKEIAFLERGSETCELVEIVSS